MKLISDFEISPFTTVNYVSSEAKAIWKQIIQECSELTQRLELVSVAEGQRKCAWRTVAVSQIAQLTTACMALGLNVYPIHNIATWGDGFAHKVKPAVKNCPTSTYCIISKNIVDAQAFKNAHMSGNHPLQGEFLGFPKCCTEFFNKNWPEYYDPIWQAAENTKGKKVIDNETIEIEEPNAISNPILRYIGLRVGFHIPCSLGCAYTAAAGTKRLSLCKTKKDKDTAEILLALLSMPMEWSVLHGIALIKTPIFYVRANSLPATKKHTVKLMGKFIPKETMPGKNFPFNIKNKRSLAK